VVSPRESNAFLLSMWECRVNTARCVNMWYTAGIERGAHDDTCNGGVPGHVRGWQYAAVSCAASCRYRNDTVWKQQRKRSLRPNATKWKKATTMCWRTVWRTVHYRRYGRKAERSTVPPGASSSTPKLPPQCRHIHSQNCSHHVPTTIHFTTDASLLFISV
jgi:hypothetical protein